MSTTKRRCTSSTPHDPVTLFITTAGTDRTNPDSSCPRTRLFQPCLAHANCQNAISAWRCGSGHKHYHATSGHTKQFSSLGRLWRARIPGSLSSFYKLPSTCRYPTFLGPLITASITALLLPLPDHFSPPLPHFLIH